MRVEENTKKEIEDKLEGMGDYVKMDYLSSCLKKNIGIDSRRFVLIRLAGIYEGRNMFVEGGKLMRHAADLNASKQGKIIDFVKSCELFVKGGSFDEADVSYFKALKEVEGMQKNRVIESVKEFYNTQGRIFLSKDKRKHAMEVYEKMLRDFDLNVEEEMLVKRILVDLYEKLGKIKEYMLMKRSLE